MGNRRACDETYAVALLVLAPADTLVAKRRWQCPLAGAGARGRRKNTPLNSGTDQPDNRRVMGRPSVAVVVDRGRYMDPRTGRCREDPRLGSVADWPEMGRTQVVDSRQAAVAVANIARRLRRLSRQG